SSQVEGAFLTFASANRTTTMISPLSLHDALPILVGSSSSRRSGCENSTEASATRIRQPPENDEAGRFWASVSNPRPARIVAARRSEEHTSELQSRENLVCRLLLEKKKNQLRYRTY